jgi:hypothetical protein
MNEPIDPAIVTSVRDHIRSVEQSASDIADALCDATDMIEDLVLQSCHAYSEDGHMVHDSMAITAYAEAMRFLAKVGRFTITHEKYRRVIGYFNPTPKPPSHVEEKENSQPQPQATPETPAV